MKEEWKVRRIYKINKRDVFGHQCPEMTFGDWGPACGEPRADRKQGASSHEAEGEANSIQLLQKWQQTAEVSPSTTDLRASFGMSKRRTSVLDGCVACHAVCLEILNLPKAEYTFPPEVAFLCLCKWCEKTHVPPGSQTSHLLALLTVFTSRHSLLSPP